MLLEAQTLIGFLSFYAKVVRLDWLFMHPLYDFVAKISSGRLGFCQKIFLQIVTIYPGGKTIQNSTRI